VQGGAGIIVPAVHREQQHKGLQEELRWRLSRKERSVRPPGALFIGLAALAEHHNLRWVAASLSICILTTLPLSAIR